MPELAFSFFHFFFSVKWASQRGIHASVSPHVNRQLEVLNTPPSSSVVRRLYPSQDGAADYMCKAYGTIRPRTWSLDFQLHHRSAIPYPYLYANPITGSTHSNSGLVIRPLNLQRQKPRSARASHWHVPSTLRSRTHVCAWPLNADSDEKYQRLENWRDGEMRLAIHLRDKYIVSAREQFSKA